MILSTFINIKQKSITTQIQKSFTQMKLYRFKQVRRQLAPSLWIKFIQQNFAYAHLQEELQDYNHFWSSYLSFVFVFYVLLITFIIFICLFGRSARYMNAFFGLVLNFHICILSIIIYFCGNISLRNEKLSTSYIEMVARMNQSQYRLTSLQTIKVTTTKKNPSSPFNTVARFAKWNNSEQPLSSFIRSKV